MADPSITPPQPEQLVAAAHQFYRFGWLPGHRGSLSLREGQKVMITAAGIHPLSLSTDHLVTLDTDPASTTGRAGDDEAIHQAIYEGLDEVGAIFYLHHLEASLCSDRDYKRGFTHFHDLQALRALGVEQGEAGLQANITVVHPEGFDSVADAVADALQGVDHPHTPCFTIKGYGLYVWGADVAQARRHAEICAYLFDYSWRRPMHPKKSRAISGFG